jgi:hypothetical protein
LLYICIYIYICVCVCVCVYTYIHIHIYIIFSSIPTCPSFYLPTPLPCQGSFYILLNFLFIYLPTSVKLPTPTPQKPQFCSHITLLGREIRFPVVP